MIPTNGTWLMAIKNSNMVPKNEKDFGIHKSCTKEEQCFVRQDVDSSTDDCLSWSSTEDVLATIEEKEELPSLVSSKEPPKKQACSKTIKMDGFTMRPYKLTNLPSNVFTRLNLDAKHRQQCQSERMEKSELRTLHVFRRLIIDVNNRKLKQLKKKKQKNKTKQLEKTHASKRRKTSFAQAYIMYKRGMHQIRALECKRAKAGEESYFPYDFRDRTSQCNKIEKKHLKKIKDKKVIMRKLQRVDYVVDSQASTNKKVLETKYSTSSENSDEIPTKIKKRVRFVNAENPILKMKEVNTISKYTSNPDR